MSYWEKSSSIVYIYSVAMIISMITYSFALGPTAGFQFALYSLILLYCYKTDDSPAVKYIISVVITLTIISIWIYLTFASKIVEFTHKQDITLVITNTLYLSITFVTISIFYYSKFASAEHKLIKYARKLEKLATMDPLTKLTNRRGMMDHLEAFVKESKNNDNWHLSLAISDIDFFKRINDTYGHDAGDYVLVEIGRMFNEFMKDKGHIARWGGEEFLFAFEKNNGDYAYEELNKLKYQIEKKTFKYKDFVFYVTMTFGLEEYDDSIGLQKTIEHADSKLYQGKSEGRNRVIY
ncbi:MAG: GGDEF domain-containing protein [Lachnospiraceae bacterium]|nr:GGDEF domain-containing protein [Lachnospiraceae bacterium]